MVKLLTNLTINEFKRKEFIRSEYYEESFRILKDLFTFARILYYFDPKLPSNGSRN
jgi:hypothetical protein